MADVHSKDIRSFNMSRIRGKDTKPEILVRKYLFSAGLRYRLHDKRLPGKPDLVFPKFKKVVFINGCFWHGHRNCNYFVIPKSNSSWWENKINNTRIRDAKNIKIIKERNWSVIVVWECELKSRNRLKTLESLKKKIIAE